MWRYMTIAHREALVINCSGAFLSTASLLGGSDAPPFVLSVPGLALTLYALHLYRKIWKGDA